MNEQRERVIIVGVETEANYQHFKGSMAELTRLTETANGDVVYSMVQKRSKFDRQTLIGKGKLSELKLLVTAYEADLVVFNHELSPRQSQLLSDAVAVRVIDRVQLILDIFALRARSKEGKLQVELAQLNYLLPRLAGQGQHLSRLGGGIGTRGPGETKLETDRRHIRDKIFAIKRELKAVSAHRARSREKRQNSDLFQIGLIGYTNAGKSTIMNELTASDTYSQDQLFATLDPLTKKWQLPQGMIVTLTDTVGFIQDLPTQLIEAFQSTLEESRGMDLLLHVVDVSASDRLQQEQTVLQLLKELALDKIPLLTIYNKSDQLSPGTFLPTLFPNLLLSAKLPADKKRLIQAIRSQMMELLFPYQFEVSADQGAVLSELKRHTLLLSDMYQAKTNSYLVKGFAKKGSRWVSHSENA
ncbi:GTPase HflX [Enterococcus faecalis]